VIAATRSLMAVAIVSLAAGPAAAQGADLEAHYERLDGDEVRAIETDLIWTEHTMLLSDGYIGKGAVAAIRRFERAIGAEEDGMLTRGERRALALRAGAARGAVGYRVVPDRATGARIGLPTALVGEAEPTRRGTRYAASDGSVEVRTFRFAEGMSFRGAYEDQLARAAGEVTFRLYRDDEFGVVGLTGTGRKFHTRARREGDEIRAYTLSYDETLADVIGPLGVAMTSDFDAFAADPAPRSAASSRAYRPQAIHLPRRPAAGGAVTVAAGGFPAGRAVEAGFRLDGDRFDRQWSGRTDGTGQVELRIDVPARLGPGTRASVVVATVDGAHVATTDIFELRGAVGRPAVRPASRTITGMITSESEACQTLRDTGGRLWSMRSAEVARYAAGAPVQVTARMTEARCAGAPLLDVQAIARR
jgi:hypothetical protein